MKIVIGEEYKIKIENGTEFNGSIFKNVYNQAAKSVQEIIIQSKFDNTTSISDDSYNNIIAFTGERGTGKSSSMISFANAIINQKNNSHSIFFQNENHSYKSIIEKKITAIDVIDPSLFKGDDKLFEIIISKMFSKFQEHINNSDNKEINHDQKRDLINGFQKVFNNLKVVHNGKNEVYDKEAIEALSDLAYGTNLKNSFFKLVEKYLLTIGDKSDFLLIIIDDFDLNISGAYEMLEDIRQFLIQRKIIILVACKIEQLQDSINNEIVKEYRYIIKEKESISENVSDKSKRYLEKMFPLEHRLQTPNLMDNSIYDEYYTIDLKGSKDSYLKKKKLEDIFIELIYKNTKLIITKSEGIKNLFIPNTIRDFTNTVSYIYRGDSLLTIKKYLFKEISNNLKGDLYNLFFQLDKTPDKLLNQYIVNSIGAININKVNHSLYPNRQFSKSKSNDILSVDSIHRIVRSSIHYNVSFGDILSVFKSLDDHILITENELLYFNYYLKLYYSIRIEESKTNTENFSSLINGTLTNSTISFLPSEKGGLDRDEFKIDHKPIELLELIEKLNNSDKNSVELYYWLSFFFTTLGTPNTNFRQQPERLYNSSIQNKVGTPHKSVNFNSIAFIYNILEPEITFDRFSDNSILKEDLKLFNDLKEWNTQNLKDGYLDIFNISLFNEFLYELNAYESDKDSFSSYSDRMHTYIIKGFTEIINKFKVKYSFINIENLLNNPFIKYWEENLDEVNILFSIIRTEYSSEEKLKELNSLLKKYLKRIPDATPNRRPSVFGNLLNKISDLKIKPNSNYNELIKELKEFQEEVENDTEMVYINQEYLEELLTTFKYNG